MFPRCLLEITCPVEVIKEMKERDSLCQTFSEIATKQTQTCTLKVQNMLGKDAHTLTSFLI